MAWVNYGLGISKDGSFMADAKTVSIAKQMARLLNTRDELAEVVKFIVDSLEGFDKQNLGPIEALILERAKEALPLTTPKGSKNA